ncbi:hypothetical protein L1D14_04270 [Vibrio tubiashii]|uniref:hypothetical protein n=1 Tax=Vibrio tubiashii TaxID=29498 RepID=UPI001EFE83D4|nr:hypothetical protein [Vibrio tubiashii]MCG9575447.1 hypothetical protein [Vibrio tubiashii]
MTHTHRKPFLIVALGLAMAACGGGGSGDSSPSGSDTTTSPSESTSSTNSPSAQLAPQAFNLLSLSSVNGKPKTLSMNWQSSQNAVEYDICKKVDGECDKLGSTSQTSLEVDVNNSFVVQASDYYVVAKNGSLESRSNELTLTDYSKVVGYLKAPNAAAGDLFGAAGDVSEDATTIIIGATEESSNSTDINSTDTSLAGSGAAYVLKKTDGQWQFVHYFKEPINRANYRRFGRIVLTSDDGNIYGVTSTRGAYIFEGSEHKQSMTTPLFGAIALSGDGKTFFVRGVNEKSVDIWTRSEVDGSWSKNHTITNPSAQNNGFATSLATNYAGTKVLIGAPLDQSNAVGIDGDMENTSISRAGAAFVYEINGGAWDKKTYIKASVHDVWDQFGQNVFMHPTKDILLIRAMGESSASGGVNGDKADNSVNMAGAVIMFKPDGNGKYEEAAYLKATSPRQYSSYGASMTMNKAADLIAIGESNSDSSDESGAVYLYKVTSDLQVSAFKDLVSVNKDAGDWFGTFTAFAGEALLVGAPKESSNSKVIQSGQANNDLVQSGAAYLY